MIKTQGIVTRTAVFPPPNDVTQPEEVFYSENDPPPSPCISASIFQGGNITSSVIYMAFFYHLVQKFHFKRNKSRMCIAKFYDNYADCGCQTACQHCLYSTRTS